MKEQLELKHLAPYLAYGTRVKITHLNDGNKVSTLKLNSVVILDWERGNFEIKPILRPLSDLTEEIELNGKKFVPINCFHREFNQILKDELKVTNGNLLIEFLPYGIIVKLLEWHFDVFGLIDKGLAISYEEVGL